MRLARTHDKNMAVLVGLTQRRPAVRRRVRETVKNAPMSVDRSFMLALEQKLTTRSPAIVQGNEEHVTQQKESIVSQNGNSPRTDSVVQDDSHIRFDKSAPFLNDRFHEVIPFLASISASLDTLKSKDLFMNLTTCRRV
jgi:hypothetical protein